MRGYISAVVDRVEHGQVVIRFADGQEVKIAKEELQPLPAIGAELGITIALAEDAKLEQNALAKHLLNQLLGNEG